ncbi:MAG: hypothetical protein AAFQ80_07710 [Cyanobacteria bacterium J06621_8]
MTEANSPSLQETDSNNEQNDIDLIERLDTILDQYFGLSKKQSRFDFFKNDPSWLLYIIKDKLEKYNRDITCEDSYGIPIKTNIFRHLKLFYRIQLIELESKNSSIEHTFNFMLPILFLILFAIFQAKNRIAEHVEYPGILYIIMFLSLTTLLLFTIHMFIEARKYNKLITTYRSFVEILETTIKVLGC